MKPLAGETYVYRISVGWLNAWRPNINTLLQYGTVHKSNVHNLSLSDVSISVGIGQKAGSPPGIQRSFGQNN